MKRLLIAVAVTLSACGAETSPPATQAVTASPAIKLPPPKYYSLKDGLEYGYEQGISKDDADKGQVAPKLMMVKYVGERNGVIQFYTKEGDVVAVFQCERPCEFVKQMVFYDGRLVKKEHIRAADGSIAAAIISDAMNGYLDKYVRDRNGKPHALWFDESGPKWTPM